MDGLRAIAALSIVALHCCAYAAYFHGWAGAYIRQLAGGVTVFFLLSGFLLYRPFLSGRLNRKKPIRLRDYMRRRLLRIVPAYWLALTVLAAWPGLPGNPVNHDWWRYYLFVQDFNQRTLFNGLGTAWSLGTEVMFYLALPLYAVVLGRHCFHRTVRRFLGFEFLALALFSAGSLAFRYEVASAHPNLGYTLAGTFDWFALGMGLAVLSVAVEQNVTPHLVRVCATVARHPSACWLVAGGAFTLTAAYFERTRRYDAYSAGPLHYFWGATAVCLLLPAVFPGNGHGIPRRLLESKPAAWLGLVSYGIYLWHLPLIPRIGEAIGGPHGSTWFVLLLTLLVASATIVCAAGSYYLVERHILRLKHGFRRGNTVGPQARPFIE